MTHNSFCKQTLLHRGSYTQRFLHTGAFLYIVYGQNLFTPLHRKPLRKKTFACRRTERLLYIAVLAQRRLSTQKLLHRKVLTHRSVCRQRLLLREPFSWRSFCTEKLLHGVALEQTTFAQSNFTHKSFYKQRPCHRGAFTQKSLYTLHGKVFAPSGCLHAKPSRTHA